MFLETELGEALNDKIYLKSDRGTQLVNPDAQRLGKKKTVSSFITTEMCLRNAGVLWNTV